MLAALTLAAVLLSSCALFGNGDATSAVTDDGTLPYVGTTTAEPGTSGMPDTTTEPADTTAPIPPESSGDETTAPAPVITYTDPLTGLESMVDLRRVLPISITLDNLSVAAPQSGISRADILLEVLVEGGITRLIMIPTNTAAVRCTVPCVRSAITP